MDEQEEFERGRGLLKAKRFQDAIEVFSGLLAPSLLFSRNTLAASAFMGRGRAFQLLHEYKKAIKDFHLALEYSGGDKDEEAALRAFRILTMRASCFAAIQRPDLAMKDFRSAAQISIEDPALFTGQSQCLMYCGKMSESRQVCELALILDQENAVAHQQKGIIHSHLSELKEAVSAFDKAIALKPQYETYILRGKAFQAMNDLNQAQEDYGKAISLDSSSPLAFAHRAALFASLGSLDLAIADADQWILTAANLADKASAFASRGIWRGQLRDFDTAVSDFTSALELDSSNLAAYNYRAKAYMQLNRYQEAIDDLVHAAELDTSNSHLVSTIAEQYVALGEFDNAAKYWSKAIQLEPQSKVLYRHRATAYTKMGMYESSASDLSVAIKLDERNFTLYRERAAVYTNLKQYAKAIADVNNAMHLNFYDPAIYEQRAVLFLRMNLKKFGRTDLLQAKRMRRDQTLLKSKADHAYVINPGT